MTLEFETIAAISTPPGEGAIGIVRLSGEQAIEIADRVYRSGSKALTEQQSHTIHYGHIENPKTNEVIDEVMVSVMREPKTFTREDVVVAVIRTKYSLNKELAIRRELINSEPNSQQAWEEFCEFIGFAKEVANTLEL